LHLEECFLPNTTLRKIQKEISSVADLALHGAPPAFRDPLHVGRPNIANRDEFIRRTSEMLDRAWLSNNGPFVQEFEALIAAYVGVKHIVATCNGTVALELAIRALGLKGEVIVPSYTFIATAHSVLWQGLTPVFADINQITHCIDPESVLSAITPRTTGVLGVHLWGHAAPVRELKHICDRKRIKLFFDAAHAFGCSYGGQLIGNFGECEIFSFHATKFLNSLEGGAIATNDDDLAESLRLMRNFGFAGYDNVVIPGTNGKMVESCAAMGIVNLQSIDAIIRANQLNHRRYADGLGRLPGLRLFSFPEIERNNWQYVVVEIGPEFGASRDLVLKALHAENILARKYFWPGCHRMEPYRKMYPSYDLALTNTNEVSERVIVLPTGFAVEAAEIDVVCSVFRHIAAP
jgi:dTDP-4-amino-4,6-dideoxygalactose transaminase